MKLWQLGKPNSLIYKLYDHLRNRLNQSLASYLYGFILSRKKVKILEAGSGPGFCASCLNKKENVLKTVILDIDDQVLNLAKKRDPSLNTARGNILKINYPDNQFDLVYNSSVLEHITKYNQAFSEMVRVCKPGGFVFVGFPYKYGPLFVFNFFPKNGKIRRWVGRFLTRREILQWIKVFPVKLKDQIFYFLKFFQGFMFQKRAVS